MDQYADDLAELFETLDLRKVMMVGHSTGGAKWPDTLVVTAQSACRRPC
jgi:pimeloyl-ACP methyl ester carboxylesterase